MWSTDQLIKSEKWVRQKEEKKTPKEKQQKSKTMFISITVWHYCNVYCVSQKYRFTLDQKVKTNTLTGPLLLSLTSSGLGCTSSWVTMNPPFSTAVWLNKGAPMHRKLLRSSHGHQCRPGPFLQLLQASKEPIALTGMCTATIHFNIQAFLLYSNKVRTEKGTNVTNHKLL